MKLHCQYCGLEFSGRLYWGKPQRFCSASCRSGFYRAPPIAPVAAFHDLTPGNKKLIEKLAQQRKPLGEVHYILQPVSAVQREAVSQEYYKARLG